MKVEIVITLIITIVHTVKCGKIYSEGYCWRDFDGIVPKDAFIAGYDKNNNPLYVGQVLFEEKIITGELHDNDDTIFFEFGEQERTANRNIKIFCTQYQEKLSWVETSAYQYEAVKNKNLVKGGHQPGFATYIGRVRDYYNQTHVGKVICREHACLALYTSKQGEQWKQHYRYEVLQFLPQIKGKEES